MARLITTTIILIVGGWLLVSILDSKGIDPIEEAIRLIPSKEEVVNMMSDPKRVSISDHVGYKYVLPNLCVVNSDTMSYTCDLSLLPLSNGLNVRMRLLHATDTLGNYHMVLYEFQVLDLWLKTQIDNTGEAHSWVSKVETIITADNPVNALNTNSLAVEILTDEAAPQSVIGVNILELTPSTDSTFTFEFHNGMRYNYLQTVNKCD